MRMASEAMKGNSSLRFLATMAGKTWSPSATLCWTLRIASVVRKASGMAIRRLAESSRVRSIHWVEAVWAGLAAMLINHRARAVTRSERMGLAL